MKPRTIIVDRSRAGELGNRLGPLRHGVLGELTGENQADGGLGPLLGLLLLLLVGGGAVLGGEALLGLGLLLRRGLLRLLLLLLRRLLGGLLLRRLLLGLGRHRNLDRGNGKQRKGASSIEAVKSTAE
ncbi:hypothetical protein C4D60_Mb08t21290 [Musa balbisiana]|uniref:Uncharacterized protein n=1 Tax=Musa balbisiana TaxID=52838 RepID=A0A4S8K5C6_MUSBA|nr:hypothetical protein C4D60_Mb08t21290 [Musa balbisiana]